MAVLLTNNTPGDLTLPPIYGGGILTPGKSVIIQDTLANVQSQFTGVNTAFLGMNVVPDNQVGAITPAGVAGAGLVSGPHQLLNRQVISATGAGTYTPTKGTNRAKVRMVAGGGGGGGVANSAGAQTAVGGGGSSGDYLESWVDPGAGNYPLAGGALNVGVGGTAGANTGAAGGTGGDTTLVIGGTTFTCKGGQGGGFTASSASAQICVGGLGQAGISAADVAVPAEPGVPGFTQSGTIAESGQGGNSPIGSGGASKIAQAAGGAGQGFGAGGSGGCSINNAGAVTGGAGSQGLIIIEEYT